MHRWERVSRCLELLTALPMKPCGGFIASSEKRRQFARLGYRRKHTHQ
jgi:hypothetical protein